MRISNVVIEYDRGDEDEPYCMTVTETDGERLVEYYVYYEKTYHDALRTLKELIDDEIN